MTRLLLIFGLQDDLSIGDLSEGFLIEISNVAYFGEGSKPLGQKNIKTNKRFFNENHIVAHLDHEKLKRKGASNSENLPKVPENGSIDTLPLTTYHA